MVRPYSSGKYDLTALKQYVKDAGLMDKFAPQEQEDIRKMAVELERHLQGSKEG